MGGKHTKMARLFREWQRYHEKVEVGAQELVELLLGRP